MPVCAVPRPLPFATAIRTLGSHRDPALLLDAEGTILFVNDAWGPFARLAAGAPRLDAAALVGTRWLDLFPGDEPRRRHAELLDRARGGPPGAAVAWTAECNDATTARLVASRLEPVAGPPGAIAGLALTHRIVRERPIDEVYPPAARDGRGYREADGATAQCSCCRRTRRPDAPEEWDLVPELLALPPAGTRFTYCPLCLELHGEGARAAPRA